MLLIRLGQMLSLVIWFKHFFLMVSFPVRLGTLHVHIKFLGIRVKLSILTVIRVMQGLRLQKSH